MLAARGMGVASSEMESLDISVVIVLQDRAETIPTVLAHLEQQSLPAVRYEVVAVNNGSADGSLAVLERYAAGAPVRIGVVDAPRGSYARARNLGVEHTHGKALVFLDQDVLASPNLLERYVREFESAPHQLLLGTVAMHPQLPANVLTRHILQEEIRTPADPQNLAPLDWHGYNFGCSRGLLRDLGGFDEAVGGPHFLEAALAHRLAQRGVVGRALTKAYCYEWRAAAFDEERARHYARGHALRGLEESIGEELAHLLLPTVGLIERRVSQVMMPFYVRACRDAEGDVRYAARLYRRVLRHDILRGYHDARRGKSPRS